ncbi:helix-turn-helix domain-containing protein [Streptomyces qinzhouensis]|uniref:Helix-turn-helix domain-containing protein n=1 Tax=Streptomyces qinzhouensis TaxID=2599401 RepID=A0A5B8JDY6_9ACTN|nr:helix-turn-helix domain-containing protein [Streptomyces qinzhouensis]QDY79757.1 helix-turn-helix domain-containing protein [Streptomyces qinzhouensis]
MGIIVLVSALRTEDLPERDRFESWHEFTSRSILPVAVRRSSEGDFRAFLQVGDFGPIQVSRISTPGLETVRGDRLVRRSDPESYQVYLQLSGTTVVSQHGREALINAGGVVVFDSSTPYRGITYPESCESSGSCLIVQFPYVRSPFPRGVVDRIAARPLTADSGIAAIMARYIVELADRSHECSYRDAVNLGGITLDLIGAWLSRELEVSADLSPDSHRRVMEVRIHEYIRQRLGDPGLTPQAIAHAHGISVRYLYKIFQEQDLAVADWIRRRRLEGCCRDLAHPELRSRTVQAIAARWGFTDPAQFSRVFRKAFGMTPTEYRHHAVQKATRAVQG